MTHSNASCPRFGEVAIADFGPFQIAVLTTTVTVNRPLLSTPSAITERVYHHQGYLICQGQIVADLQSLDIGVVGSQQGPFQAIQRLAPAVNLAFEIRSRCSLPETVLTQARFAYQLPNSPAPYRAVFRQICPRFVRIYPFVGVTTLPAQVVQMQAAEQHFVGQNQARLRQIPFYKASFDL